MRSDALISVVLARRLRDEGLRWDPASGDRFVVADRGMNDEVFTLAEMTVEVHDFVSEKVIGFNGVTEWALDCVEADNAVWLPGEAQLREALGGTFRQLTRIGTGWRVELEVAGAPVRVEDPKAADAYGRALLYLITGESADNPA